MLTTGICLDAENSCLEIFLSKSVISVTFSSTPIALVSCEYLIVPVAMMSSLIL